MNEKEITCIICPLGCKILIKTDGTKAKVIKGNKCKRGIEYALQEALDPRRMLTTSIVVKGGEWPLVSVKTSRSVPKEKIFSVLKEIKKTSVNAPVKFGQVLITNVANTGTDIIATKKVKRICET
jgi:CxxC motif-containing protein